MGFFSFFSKEKKETKNDKREYVITPTEKFYSYLNSKDEEITLNEIIEYTDYYSFFPNW